MNSVSFIMKTAPQQGQPSLAPWRLAMGLVMQFLEHLSD